MTTTYKVTGAVPYGDWQPGDEFEAELDPEQEARALERGAIEIIGKHKGKAKKEEGNDA